MRNIIISSLIRESKRKSKDPGRQFLYLSKHLRVGRCEETGEPVMQSINGEQSWCIHNRGESTEMHTHNYAEDLAEIESYRKYRKRLFKLMIT